MKLLILLFISFIFVYPQTDVIKQYKYMYERRQQTTPEIGGYSLNSSATNQYIAVDYNTYIFGNTAFTYEAWFNASTFSPAFELGNRFIPIGNQRCWRYYVEATRFRIFFSTDGTGLTTSIVNINYTFNKNTNYHIVATYDGSQCSLYVNGSYVGVASISGGYFNGNALLRIGLTTTGSTYAVGKIYLVRYFNGILNSSQITQLYNNGRPDLVDGYNIDNKCVIELLPDRAGIIGWANTIPIPFNTDWADSYHAYTVNNPQALTANNQIIYDSKANITGNTTLSNVVPAGYIIREITINTNSSYYLNISGVTSGGTDVLNNYYISIQEETIPINVFISMLNAGSLYLQSSGWYGTSAITIKMEKIN